MNGASMTDFNGGSDKHLVTGCELVDGSTCEISEISFRFARRESGNFVAPHRPAHHRRYLLQASVVCLERGFGASSNNKASTHRSFTASCCSEDDNQKGYVQSHPGSVSMFMIC